MKYSMTLAASLASFVVMPAASVVAVNSTTLQIQEMMNAATAVISVPPTCANLLEKYFAADVSNAALYEVIENCLHASDLKQNNEALKVPAPQMLKVSLPVLAHTTAKRVELPRLATVEHAVSAMEDNAKKLAVHRANFQVMELPGQVDFLLCSFQVPGVQCEDGHFFPESGFIRKVAHVAFHLFGKQLKIGKAVDALDNVNAHKAEVVETMGKMMKALMATYPTGEQDTKDVAKWTKTYRLVHANLDVVSGMLNLDMLEKKPNALEGKTFFSSPI